MRDEITFLREIIENWDKSLERMSGVDGRIYAKIQYRIKFLEDNQSKN